METEERGEAEFPSTEVALEWLRERPQFMEVLGPVRTELEPEVEAQLRKAMRPLDSTELARRAELDGEREVARKAELKAMNDRAIEEANPVSSSLKVIQWQRGRGLFTEGGEAIPDDLAAAALEWIRERDRWVHARRQHVSAARLSIGPSTGDPADRISDTSEFSTAPGFSDLQVG